MLNYNLMEITFEKQNVTIIVSLKGRLDAYGAKEFQEKINLNISEDILGVVFDMIGVDYLSSASLRVFLIVFKKLKKRGGTISLSNLQPYAENVLNISGFSEKFPIFESTGEALAFCAQSIREKDYLDNWQNLEFAEVNIGSFRFIPGSDNKGTINVLGHVKDVLHASVTTSHLCSKRFFETEYSIGLGGLGERVDDYFKIMGEMITIGGTMVWLPTDGHDTPDFLIPKKDSGQVTIRTAFNASISGSFNELIMFESNADDGTKITDLYRSLFDIAKKRNKAFKGALGLAMLSRMGVVYSSGVTKSPVKDFAPANGEMIIHPENFPEWFEVDKEPRHSNVTALITGCGVDFTMDLSHYDKEKFDAVFYTHPGNVGAQTELLHNHGVFFSELPMPEKCVNLKNEIQTVVDQGDFIDMRHLLDSSTITRAFIGISYIDEFCRDPHGFSGYYDS